MLYEPQRFISGSLYTSLSVCCLSINVQGVIFNRSGSNLNPICISKLSRGTFILYFKFSFFDLFLEQFSKISRSFFQNSDRGLKLWHNTLQMALTKTYFHFFRISQKLKRIPMIPFQQAYPNNVNLMRAHPSTWKIWNVKFRLSSLWYAYIKNTHMKIVVKFRFFFFTEMSYEYLVVWILCDTVVSIKNW